ncbi:hypothetical protein H8S10_05060 [Clostridium sp. NSJ-49]|uniref:hypothetical protein n=1 Tax=Clostridium TaxID=1485 RepID=UPI00164AD4AF|nr:hypothetical protein [Clostridium sp. NSJ-49]MBC5624823.1 hypothetical protein [Clostridium sp. NSJ-49]
MPKDKLNISYMISPLVLTERQLLIYHKLYIKCDFSDMTVKYTYEQLANDIKSINISKKIANNEVKYLMEMGYLKEVKKGTKGSPNIFKMVKISEFLGNELGTNREQIGNERSSKNEGTESNEEMNREQIGNEKVTPIKDKRIKNNIYSDLIKNYPGKKIKAVRDKKLPKILKEYSIEEIERCITRYAEECKGRDKKFILNESTFWNGRYVDYLDENFEEVKNPKEKDVGDLMEQLMANREE